MKKRRRRNSGNQPQGPGIDIAELLAAPLLAANHVNQTMAREQVEFMMTYCFAKDDSKENDDEDVVYHPVTIVMTMTNYQLVPATEKGEPPELREVVTNFQLPLITIVPFNALSVNEVEVNFAMEITSSMTMEEKKDIEMSVSKGGDSTNDTHVNKPAKKVALKGTVSYDSKEQHDRQYQTQNAAKMAVNMKAGVIPLPVGLKSILEIYSKNLQPKQIEDDFYEDE